MMYLVSIFTHYLYCVINKLSFRLIIVWMVLFCLVVVVVFSCLHTPFLPHSNWYLLDWCRLNCFDIMWRRTYFIDLLTDFIAEVECLKYGSTIQWNHFSFLVKWSAVELSQLQVHRTSMIEVNTFENNIFEHLSRVVWLGFVMNMDGF